MKKLLSAFLLLSVSAVCHAQGSVNASSAGATSDAACSVTSCLTFQVGNAGGVSFSLSGTFSGTLTFESSGNNGTTYSTLLVTPTNSTTAVTTATAAGTCSFST